MRVHKHHQYNLISDTFEEYKADITASIQPIRKQKGIVEDKLKELNARYTEVSNQRALLKANLHREIQSFIDLLRIREAELVDKLDQIVVPKLKNLEAQRDEMKSILAGRDSCLSLVTESLRTGSEGEIIKMKKRVVEQIEEVTSKFINEDALTPCEEADIAFVTSTTFAYDCRLVGDFAFKASSEKSYATGDGLEVAMVNEKTSTFVYALDHRECPCKTVPDRIKLHINLFQKQILREDVVK